MYRNPDPEIQAAREKREAIERQIEQMRAQLAEMERALKIVRGSATAIVQYPDHIADPARQIAQIAAGILDTMEPHQKRAKSRVYHVRKALGYTYP